MRTPLVPSLAAVALVAGAGSARSDDVHCPPHLGAETVDGNVLVAAPCRLEGTVVIGNVHLFAGGSLVSRNGTRVGGSVQAENADFVDLQETTIDGNVQLDGLVGDRSLIVSSRVGGSIQLNENRSRIEVLDNTVDADVQAFGGRGQVVIADNRIDGNLQCKSNAPPPAGGNNLVAGNQEDQCADLSPEESTPASDPAPPAAAGGGGGGIDGATLLIIGLVAAARRYRRPAPAGCRRLPVAA